MSAPTWMRRAGLVAAGAMASTAPILMAEQVSDESANSPLRALAAADAWRDVLEAHRAPQLPPPSDTESAIVILDGASLADYAPGDRKAALAQIALQQATVEPSLIGLGATINFRYRALANGFGIRVPTGRLALVAELPEVAAIYPVTYLAPAQDATSDPQPQPLPGATGTPTSPQATTPAATPAGTRPATIALIDAGIQAEHPWLGGGIGPERLIVGGANFVGPGDIPTARPESRFAEAHGTQVAGIILRSPALQGLAPERIPRMLAYRVVARELVDGRVRALARTDRVLAAMERAVDPNLDGDLEDHATVMLLSLVRGMDGAGSDPLADAARRADGAGTLVISPAGNDGPTFGPIGTIAGPAASEHVLTVGGVGAEVAPRTADLELAVGPATAKLAGLPLLGSPPPAAALPVVVLAGPDGLARGDDPRDYVDLNGQSRVGGAIAVVARGGGTLADKARAAAQAGAFGLAVWDQDGPGLFPGIRAGADIPIPVMGLGARQGQVLLDNPGFAARIIETPPAATGRAVPSFSSRGPTAEGGLEPDLIAPAVDVVTAFPGAGPEPLVGHMTGTSAAAAHVAGLALRLRADHPQLTPADVRSLLIQNAEALPGVPTTDQGAGVARPASVAPVAIAPAVVSGVRRVDGATRLTVRLHELTGAPARYRLAVTKPDGQQIPPGAAFAVAAGGYVDGVIDIPPGTGVFVGTLHVVSDAGQSLGTAPVYVAPKPRIPRAALKVPQVRVAGDTVEARVSVGIGDRRSNSVVVAPIHSLGLWLVPAGGGAPIRMSGAKQTGDWPVGTYRFVITRLRADGKELAAGPYRLRVKGVASDGQILVRESKVFRLK